MNTQVAPPAGGRSSKLSQAIRGTAETQRREATPYERFRHQLSLIRRDVAALVGEDKVDKFVRVCLNAVQYNTDLLGADRRTLFLACLEAAQDGLLPDGTEAVFNIYKTKIKEGQREVWVDMVQYLPMAYGLVQKIYESGATYVDAVAVRAKDKFEYERGDNPRILHVPYDGNDDPGEVKAAYVVVKYPKLETKREVMFRRDIEMVKSKSKAQTGMMWKDFYDQAAIKSVIHRINKQLPQSEKLQRTLAHDNKAVGLVDVNNAPDEASSLDLTAIVDSRLETDLRNGAMGAGAGTGEGTKEKVVAGTDEPEPKAETTTGAAAGDGSQQQPPAPPKQGDPGTPELKAKFLGQLDNAQSKDVLDIVMDDVRFYVWQPADLQEVTVKYQERSQALQPQ